MTRWSSFIVLMVGICVGWMGRGLVEQNEESQAIREKLRGTERSAESFSAQQPQEFSVQHKPMNHAPPSAVSAKESISKQRTPKIESPQKRLQKMLAAQQFEQAVSFVYDIMQKSESDGVVLREDILSYLKQLDSSSSDTLFIDLVNAYLGVFYQDIEVLLLLAKFNANHHYYSEAIGVYQLAVEYAYDLNERQKVIAEFAEFIGGVDQYLVSQNDWLNLSIVYESADLVGLLNDRQRLRQADVYIANDDVVLATALLQSLQGSTVGAEAKKRLNEIEGAVPAEERATQDLANSTAYGAKITKRGNQYVTEITLGEEDVVNLLIDTGASMTTISQEAFDQLTWNTHHRFLGSRMFNTANGIARGSVYVVDRVAIGGYILTDHQVAVMDFSMNGSIAGLLGMNTLSLFEFQFDDAAERLRLKPRR